MSEPTTHEPTAVPAPIAHAEPRENTIHAEPVPAHADPVASPAHAEPVAETMAPAEPELEPAPIPPEPQPFKPTTLDAPGLDLLFHKAHTTWTWRDEPVTDDTIRTLYDTLKLGPTSANASPARFMFLRTQSARDRLRWTLSDGNIEKTLRAPVVAIVAHEPKFYEELPRLFPGADARSWFAHNEELAAITAFRNGTLQGAYLIMAARALGLSCGPMSGFDTSRVDTEFLIATGWKSNFLIAMGYADDTPPPIRAPRLAFDEACRLL